MVVRRIIGGLFLCSRHALGARPQQRLGICNLMASLELCPKGSLFWSHYSTSGAPQQTLMGAPPPKPKGATQECLSDHETRKLLKLVKIEELKKQLLITGKDCMTLEELLELCEQLGMASSNEEAGQLVKGLDESGVILVFRNKVFLRPEKVAEVMAKAIPLALTQENDPRREELKRLEKEKEEIDAIAHKQVRTMLWAGLTGFTLQSALFFRLTFWDLSWDVMEPITFFVTSSSLIAGFLFFILTSREPSYRDLMHSIHSSKQRKLMKKRNFDADRLKQLQMQYYPSYARLGATDEMLMKIAKAQ